MVILFLTQILPYPPDAGPRVKTWNVLRFLAKSGHRIILVSFVRPEEAQFLSKVEEICDVVIPVKIRRSRIRDLGYWIRAQYSGRPFLIERDDLSSMRAEVSTILDNHEVDLIHADQLTMAQFVSSADINIPKVFDAHNAVYLIVDRMAANANWPLSVVLQRERRQVEEYEQKVVQTFDRTLTVTEEDKKALLSAGPKSREKLEDKIRVIPIAVDTQALQPAARQPDAKKILTLGTLHYPPNADGIRWFINDVFPLVRTKLPDVSIAIVGKNPPRDFRRAALELPKHIRVMGYIPDLDPIMDEVTMMVVPVRAGGGMRVRILEAFARGMPVVTTTIGLEGIEAVPGRDVLVADTPEDFADQVCRILLDSQLQRRLAGQARKLVEVRYDWQIVLKEMGEVYAEFGRA